MKKLLLLALLCFSNASFAIGAFETEDFNSQQQIQNDRMLENQEQMLRNQQQQMEEQRQAAFNQEMLQLQQGN